MRVEFKNIDHYQGKFNFKINHLVDGSRMVAIVGPNGAGKSTLLKICSGLIQPLNGSCLFEGYSLPKSYYERARKIAWLPAQPRVYSRFSVREILTLVESQGFCNRASVDQIIIDFGLTDLQREIWQDLSIGQQQRVSLARIFIQSRKKGLILLDEPFAPLDPSWSSCLHKKLKSYSEAGGISMVALHDLDLALSFDEVWVLDKGLLVRFGDPKEILEASFLESIWGISYERFVDSQGFLRLIPNRR